MSPENLVPRKIGRPRITDGSKKCHSVSMRFRGDTKAKLLAATAASGRSLAEEIERRVQFTFDREAMLDDVREAVADALRPEPKPAAPDTGLIQFARMMR